jgi:hypothetical protein
MEEARHVDSEQKYVRPMEDSSGKEEQGPPLNQAILGSGFSVTSKDSDMSHCLELIVEKWKKCISERLSRSVERLQLLFE